MQSWGVWVEVSAAERVQAFLGYGAWPNICRFTQELEEKHPCRWAVLLPALQIYNLCTLQCVRCWSCVRMSDDRQNKCVLLYSLSLGNDEFFPCPVSAFITVNHSEIAIHYGNFHPGQLNLSIFKFLKPGSWTVLGDLDCRLSHLSSIAQAPTWTSTLIRLHFRCSETLSLIFFPKRVRQFLGEKLKKWNARHCRHLEKES